MRQLFRDFFIQKQYMDDYTSNVLTESKNEWSILLMNYLTPHIIDGFRSIFNESVQICDKNDEMDKYLMTFQNLLTRIPKWNQQMIETERERIIKLCNCSYLEDLMTCVHIVQLKILSCVRVGSETKKINIDIPDFCTFLHNVYTNVARKLYSNIYLFEVDIDELEVQKRNREFELLVQTCIMNTIRDRIPVEALLRQYIDETQEVEVKKVETIVDTKPMEQVPPPVPPPVPEPIQENIPEPPSVITAPAVAVSSIPLVNEVVSELKQEFNQPVVPRPSIRINEDNNQYSSAVPIEIDDFEDEETSGKLKIGGDISIDELNFDELSTSNHGGGDLDLGIVEL
jgi:Family of unknown function (DUF5764)